MTQRVRIGAAVGLAATLALAAPAAAGQGNSGHRAFGRFKHIVVIYEENHSFDNLYGRWGPVNGEVVRGLASADASHTRQVGQDGVPYTCLKQNDGNLTSPPLPVTCTDPNPAVGPSAFANQPFPVDQYIPPSARTCPTPGQSAPNGIKDPAGQPGGCTEDLVHRFYQEQYQLDGGKQDRYVQGSDAVGLAMGYYDTTALPIYSYLHGAGAPSYVIADNFFQGAFGGSFLNHQVLVSAQAPVYQGADRSGSTSGCATGTADCDLHSVVDANAFPKSYPLYTPVGTPANPKPKVLDQALTEAADASGGCAPSYPGAVAPPPGTVCGDFAVNTIQPFTQPYSPGTAVGRRLPLLHNANIGDAMSARGVSWAWYAGGWDNAAGNNGRDPMHPLGPGWTNGPTNTQVGACTPPPGTVVASGATFPNCPDALFQYHHQPFGYYANYADGTQARVDHLKDETRFLADAKAGTLPAVSFVKPIGEENEHPGYASEVSGSSHLVDLIKAIQSSPEAKDTVIVATYDEFGGQWDHVSPPGTPQQRGPHDAIGPGTRIPALIVSGAIRSSGVDHTQYDTTSILATIEHGFGVAPLSSASGRLVRDAFVNDLRAAFRGGR